MSGNTCGFCGDLTGYNGEKPHRGYRECLKWMADQMKENLDADHVFNLPPPTEGKKGVFMLDETLTAKLQEARLEGRAEGQKEIEGVKVLAAIWKLVSKHYSETATVEEELLLSSFIKHGIALEKTGRKL